MVVVYRIEHQETQNGPFNVGGDAPCLQMEYSGSYDDNGYYSFFVDDELYTIEYPTDTHPTAALDGEAMQGLFWLSNLDYVFACDSKENLEWWFYTEEIREALEKAGYVVVAYHLEENCFPFVVHGESGTQLAFNRTHAKRAEEIKISDFFS